MKKKAAEELTCCLFNLPWRLARRMDAESTSVEASSPTNETNHLDPTITKAWSTSYRQQHPVNSTDYATVDFNPAIHEHYTTALTIHSRLSSNWTFARKERDVLNQPNPELLRGSPSCQYRKKEKTEDRPRRGCITAATASISRGVSSSQPPYLSLLYKRNKL